MKQGTEQHLVRVNGVLVNKTTHEQQTQAKVEIRTGPLVVTIGKDWVRTFEDLTPEKATRWLVNMGPNRRLDEAHWRGMARSARAGTFSSPTPFLFGPENKLRDGAHRCTMVKETGITLKNVEVIHGLTEQDLVMVDTNKRRNYAAILAIRGEKNPGALAAATQALYSFEYSHRLGKSSSLSTAINEELEFFGYRHPNLARSLYYGNLCRKTNLAPSVASALHYICSQFAHEKADGFFYQVGLGENLQQGDPAYTLRDRLRRVRGGHQQMRQHIMFALTIKAWNAYFRGRQLFKLSWRDTGENPEPFPLVAGLPAQTRSS